MKTVSCLEIFVAAKIAEITHAATEIANVAKAKTTISAGLESANGSESFSAIRLLKGKTTSAPKKTPVTAPNVPMKNAS